METQDAAFASERGKRSTQTVKPSRRVRKEAERTVDPSPPSNLDPINPCAVVVSTQTILGDWTQITASPSFATGWSVILYELLTRLKLPMFPAPDGFAIDTSTRSTKWIRAGITEIRVCTSENKTIIITCVVVRRKSKASKRGELFLSQRDAQNIMHAKDDRRKLQQLPFACQELQHDAIPTTLNSPRALLSRPKSTERQHTLLPDRSSLGCASSVYPPTMMTGQYNSQVGVVHRQNQYLSPYTETPTFNKLQPILLQGLSEDRQHRSYHVGPPDSTHDYNSMLDGDGARLFPRQTSFNAIGTVREPLPSQDTTYCGASMFGTAGTGTKQGGHWITRGLVEYDHPDTFNGGSSTIYEPRRGRQFPGDGSGSQFTGEGAFNGEFDAREEQGPLLRVWN